MNDDSTLNVPEDGTRINLHIPLEVTYWTNKFNCSEEELKTAVQKAGTSLSDVQAFLEGEQANTGRE